MSGDKVANSDHKKLKAKERGERWAWKLIDEW